MKCDEIKDLLYGLSEGGLAAKAAGEVRAHIAQCAGCRREYEAIVALDRSLAAVKSVAAPRAAVKNVLAEVNRIAAARRRVHARERMIGLAAAAAVLLVLSGLGIFGVTPVSPVSRMVTSEVQALSQPLAPIRSMAAEYAAKASAMVPKEMMTYLKLGGLGVALLVVIVAITEEAYAKRLAVKFHISN